jgi:beta propeller repeat protein
MTRQLRSSAPRVSLILAALAVLLVAPAATGSNGFNFSWYESPVVVAPGDQFDGAISGPFVVYTDTSAGTADVRYFDRATNSIHPAAVGPGDQQLADVNGNQIAYTTSLGGPADIFIYDIPSGVRTQITTSPADEVNPAISGRLIAYESYASGSSDICSYDLLNGATECLSAPGDQVSPSVSGTRIAYVDVNAGSAIVVYEATTLSSHTVSAGPASSPDIDGLHVAFAQSATGGLDVAVGDASGSAPVTTLHLPGDQVNPHISGDVVSFEDLASGVSHIGLWNWVTGALEYPAVSPASQSLNDLSGNRVTYTDNRSGNLDIYAVDFAWSLADSTVPVLHLPGMTVVDATSPLGAVVGYTATATDDVDGSVPVTCTPASGSQFPIGTTHVACTAHDAAGNVTNGGFDVVVRGAPEQIDALIAKVKALGLRPITQATLVAELLTAKYALAQGRVGLACVSMSLFVAEVKGLSGRTIQPPDAVGLVADAARIKAVIPC